MLGTIRLKGMTWSHPRGYDPMQAASAEWQRQTGLKCHGKALAAGFRELPRRGAGAGL